MMLTREQARIARESLCDVFTRDGDAVVVERLYTFTDPGAALYGKGQCAKVAGAHVTPGTWFPISELEPSQGLLRLEKRGKWTLPTD